MVAGKDVLRCKDCVWAVKVANSDLVYCKWLRHDVYSKSIQCPRFERYYEPF